VPYWLVIFTQHGLASRLGDELPCEARFCTTSLAKRSKQQTSQPRSLLVITMLHCKRGTRARFWSGQPRPSVEQPRPYRPRENQRSLEKATPLYGGRGGAILLTSRLFCLPAFVPQRALISKRGSSTLFVWLFVCLVVCLFGCLFVVCLFLLLVCAVVVGLFSDLRQPAAIFARARAGAPY